MLGGGDASDEFLQPSTTTQIDPDAADGMDFDEPDDSPRRQETLAEERLEELLKRPEPLTGYEVPELLVDKLLAAAGGSGHVITLADCVLRCTGSMRDGIREDGDVRGDRLADDVPLCGGMLVVRAGCTCPAEAITADEISRIASDAREEHTICDRAFDKEATDFLISSLKERASPRPRLTFFRCTFDLPA